jgi:hypothetical protein
MLPIIQLILILAVSIAVRILRSIEDTLDIKITSGRRYALIICHNVSSILQQVRVHFPPARATARKTERRAKRKCDSFFSPFGAESSDRS